MTWLKCLVPKVCHWTIERNEMKPSIDVAAKLDQILDVSLDYLVGNSDLDS